MNMFLSELVKLTTEVLEIREEEEEEDLDEDEDLVDELEDLKNDLDIKKNTIEIGKFSNDDLAGDEGIVEEVFFLFRVTILMISLVEAGFSMIRPWTKSAKFFT
jgi:hypothetical protein